MADIDVVEEEIAALDLWSRVGIAIASLPKTNDFGSQTLQRITGEVARIYDLIFEDFEKTAEPMNSSVAIAGRRSKNQQTQYIKVTEKSVVLFVRQINQLQAAVDRYDWDTIPKPNLVADLTAVHVSEDVTLKLDNIDLKTHYTQFQGKVRLDVKGAVLIEVLDGTGVLQETTVRWLGPGIVRFKTKGATFHKSLTFDASRQRTRNKNSPHTARMDFDGRASAALPWGMAFVGCHLHSIVCDQWEIGSSLTFHDCVADSFVFTSCAFSGPITFSKTEFQLEPARFLNSTFKKPVEFDRCKFERGPDFHGAKPHQNTRFELCEFRAAGGLRSTSVLSTDIAAYRVLKSHFSQQKDSRQEIVFYALEQRAVRILSKADPAERAISWIQDVVCGYGQSVSQALWAFLTWNTVFGLLYLCLPETVLSGKPLSGAITAYPGMALSLQNAFNPLALFSEKGLVEIKSLTLYVASLVQALGSLGIATLIFLTIRGKFKKGSSSES